MNDAVNEAAQVLVPLLAAGANTAVEEASKQVGKEFVGAVGSVLGRIRKHLHGAPNAHEVAGALQTELADGTIKLADLKEIVRLFKERDADTNTTVNGDVRTFVNKSTFNQPVTFN
ncbi:hypothetical protein OG809_36000 [Kribbella soli]